MCGAVLGFFGSLFSNENDLIRAQMDMQTRIAAEQKKMYESRAQAEVLAMEQKMNALKEDARQKKKNQAQFASSVCFLIHHPMVHSLKKIKDYLKRIYKMLN